MLWTYAGLMGRGEGDTLTRYSTIKRPDIRARAANRSVQRSSEAQDDLFRAVETEYVEDNSANGGSDASADGFYKDQAPVSIEGEPDQADDGDDSPLEDDADNDEEALDDERAADDFVADDDLEAPEPEQAPTDEQADTEEVEDDGTDDRAPEKEAPADDATEDEEPDQVDQPDDEDAADEDATDQGAPDREDLATSGLSPDGAESSALTLNTGRDQEEDPWAMAVFLPIFPIFLLVEALMAAFLELDEDNGRKTSKDLRNKGKRLYSDALTAMGQANEKRDKQNQLTAGDLPRFLEDKDLRQSIVADSGHKKAERNFGKGGSWDRLKDDERKRLIASAKKASKGTGDQ